ncbi:hypothetical protein JX265_001305 [Neoarthrinium moseri]|uniref:Uncharacterized protein n=1 Tax=Neoarthrinium moseri TaxID=1658444 RepID=A0A9Q0AV22_9PEZI|nr:hypothetical protein JX266_005402 [Neoarthrinium moseri]KAI1881065.1 hypothetical protein JX265_001305 [Neoarthrinium moseri]
MGIPYSKQINHAFDQVTPLVAAGFEVLKTTKNIAILLAFLQVFVALVLVLNFAALIGLLFVLNPETERERVEIVTPVLRWLGAWVLQYGSVVLGFLKVAIVLGTGGLGLMVWKGGIAGTRVPGEGGEDQGDGQEGGEDGAQDGEAGDDGKK